MDYSSKKPGTKFAPAEKASIDEIQTSYHDLKNNEVLRMFQEAMPDLALIVNKQRQLVYANNNLIKFLDVEDPLLPLGQRLGNLINCIHSEEESAGCGTSDACRFCGVVNAILQSQTTVKPIVKEARITTFFENEILAYDLKVKASPLIFQGQEYTIVCISDISDRKRRAILESSYLNEVLDAASELNNAVNSIKKEDLNSENLKNVEIAEKVNHELMDDLMSQKMLNDAEDGKLIINESLIQSLNLINELKKYFLQIYDNSEKRLFIDPFSHAIKFISDINILKRVLINILTNAFEASSADKAVRIGAKLNNRYIRFCIYNDQELSDEAKHQIFQRSFSTKAPNRGLGTYSARLLVTKYLKGNITFKSDKAGTTFFIEVPLSIE